MFKLLLPWSFFLSFPWVWTWLLPTLVLSLFSSPLLELLLPWSFSFSSSLLSSSCCYFGLSFYSPILSLCYYCLVLSLSRLVSSPRTAIVLVIFSLLLPLQVVNVLVLFSFSCPFLSLSCSCPYPSLSPLLSLSCCLGLSFFLLSLNLRWNYYYPGPFLSFLSSFQAQDDVALVFLSFSSLRAQGRNVVTLVIFCFSTFLSLSCYCPSLSCFPLSFLLLKLELNYCLPWVLIFLSFPLLSSSYYSHGPSLFLLSLNTRCCCLSPFIFLLYLSSSYCYLGLSHFLLFKLKVELLLP
jgi:hypothetical protein